MLFMTRNIRWLTARHSYRKREDEALEREEAASETEEVVQVDVFWLVEEEEEAPALQEQRSDWGMPRRADSMWRPHPRHVHRLHVLHLTFEHIVIRSLCLVVGCWLLTCFSGLVPC